MIAFTTPYLWYTSRATGVVALVLLTATVTLGTMVATRVGGRAVGRFEINEIHRSISMITMLFVAIHVLTTVVDSYVPIGVFSALVPFTSDYRRLPVAVGTIAIDLMLAVWVSSMVKDRLRNATWRYIHYLSWLSLAAALLHGFTVGSDAHRLWMIVVQVACLVVAIAAGLWRITQRPDRAAGRTAHSPLSRAQTAPATPAKARTSVPRSEPPRRTPPPAPRPRGRR